MEGACNQCAFPIQDPIAKYPPGTTPLMHAAFNGYVQCVKELLGAGADVNQIDNYNDTALMSAAYRGKHGCVMELIQSGANVNSLNYDGDTALSLASRRGFPMCVDTLLNEGANVNMITNDHMTPLMEAAYWDHLQCVQLLINAGADVNLKTSKFTALKMAAFYANHRCVEMLLSEGADVEMEGFTPVLIDAVRNSTEECKRAFDEAKLEYIPDNHNNATCVESLIEARADVNLKLKTGETALIIAASNGLNDCAHLLIQARASVNAASDDGTTPLHSAALHGSTECLHTLLTAGADVNIQDIEGRIPLLHSVWNSQKKWDQMSKDKALSHFPRNFKQKECVEMLIKEGSSVNAQTNDGISTLMKASENGYTECVKLLLEEGANVNDTCKDGCTSLMYSALFGHETCLDALLAENNVNIKENIGSTALIIASTYGHDNCVKQLIKVGADVNIKDNEGHTALIRAACFANFKCIKHLLEARADINSKTKDHITALMASSSIYNENRCKEMIEHSGNTYVAENHNVSKSIESLISEGADVNIKDATGNVPLIEAISHRNDECVILLLATGANVNATDLKGSSTLMVAINNYKSNETFDQLLKAGVDVNIMNNTGETALTLAAGRTDRYVVKELIKANCQINKSSGKMVHALTQQEEDEYPIDKPIVKLLFAVGEIFGDDEINEMAQSWLQLYENQMDLKYICREAIRRHLLHLDPNGNLFCRISELGLPEILKKYLLYDVSPDDVNSEGEDNDDGNVDYVCSDDDDDNDDETDDDETDDDGYGDDYNRPKICYPSLLQSQPHTISLKEIKNSEFRIFR